MTWPRIEALVFDFDGLILETELPILRAWQEIYADHGQQVPLEIWAETLGTTDHPWDPLAHLEAATGLKLDPEALLARRRARHDELLADLDALPGVADTLAHAGAAGLGLAVASSSSRGWVTGHLERLGLAGHFAVICTREDVARTKPDPALYLLAAERLGKDPASCVAVEDSPNGLRAAAAAGMRTVAVPSALTRGLDLSGATLLLDSLAELSLEEILARLG